ncbi:hypothetical protein [Vibrio sp. D431a]|uniref:hypothetical protein n=1 Tax=Vibrio sp. D431a TaxID=2837388 RepID=UPI002554B419|nr:hypothetical protein [Vibrio sp. D431a]MDK9793886.1 hypothetical protein [Vibrio sp. D431a]
MSSPKRKTDIDEIFSNVLSETDLLRPDVTTQDNSGKQFSYLSTIAIVKILRKHFKTNLKIENSYTLDSDVFSYTSLISIYNPQARAFVDLANGIYQISKDKILDSTEAIYELSPPAYASEAALSIALNSLGVVPSNFKTIPLSASAPITISADSGTDGVVTEEVTEEDKQGKTLNTSDSTLIEQEPDLGSVNTDIDLKDSNATPEPPTSAVEVDSSNIQKNEESSTQPTIADEPTPEVEGFPAYQKDKGGLTRLVYIRRCQELSEIGVSEETALMSIRERDRPKTLQDMTPEQSTGLKNKINSKEQSYWEGLAKKAADSKKPKNTRKAPKKRASTKSVQKNEPAKTKFNLNTLKPLDRNLVDQEVMKARRNLKSKFRLAEDKVKNRVLTELGLPTNLDPEQIYTYISSLEKAALKDVLSMF